MNVFLNFLLIPHFGIYGAAIASLVTQFFTNVLLGYIIVPIRHNNALMVRSLHPKYLPISEHKEYPDSNNQTICSF